MDSLTTLCAKSLEKIPKSVLEKYIEHVDNEVYISSQDKYTGHEIIVKYINLFDKYLIEILVPINQSPNEKIHKSVEQQFIMEEKGALAYLKVFDAYPYLHYGQFEKRLRNIEKEDYLNLIKVKNI